MDPTHAQIVIDWYNTPHPVLMGRIIPGHQVTFHSPTRAVNINLPEGVFTNESRGITVHRGESVTLTVADGARRGCFLYRLEDAEPRVNSWIGEGGGGGGGEGGGEVG